MNESRRKIDPNALVSGLVLTIAGLLFMHGARHSPTQTD